MGIGGDPALSRQSVRSRALLARRSRHAAHIDKWAEWSKINVALNFSGPIFWQVIRTPAEARDAARAKGALGGSRPLSRHRARRSWRTRHYLCGDDFTLADIQFGHLLYRYFDLEIERPERAGLRAYYERLVARPAYREHVMIPYDELRVGAA